MKIIVDKLPNKPSGCIFSKMNIKQDEDKHYIFNHYNCFFDRDYICEDTKKCVIFKALDKAGGNENNT